MKKYIWQCHKCETWYDVKVTDEKQDLLFDPCPECGGIKIRGFKEASEQDS